MLWGIDVWAKFKLNMKWHKVKFERNSGLFVTYCELVVKSHSFVTVEDVANLLKEHRQPLGDKVCQVCLGHHLLSKI